MNLFLNITRVLPLAILLALAIISQTVAMAHHGVEHSSASQFLVTICADGEVKTVVLDQDGTPSERRHEQTQCPFCILGKVFGPVQHPTFQGPARYAKSVSGATHLNHSKVEELRPDSLHCLDPRRA